MGYQYSLENYKTGTSAVGWPDATPYLKAGSKLAEPEPRGDEGRLGARRGDEGFNSAKPQNHFHSKLKDLKHFITF